MESYRDYGYADASIGHTAKYLLPPILELMRAYPAGSRVLDVGCGNGSMTGVYDKNGYQVVGIDLSERGIEIARVSHPDCRFEVLPADDKVLDNLDEQPFDIVVSTEVV